MLSSHLSRIQRASWSETTSKKGYHGRVRHVVLRNLRDHYIDELKQRTASGGTNCFSDKAMILLTRHWANTNWNGRTGLLQAAKWLIHVSRISSNYRDLRAGDKYR
jgi:hypothetical protein